MKSCQISFEAVGLHVVFRLSKSANFVNIFARNPEFRHFFAIQNWLLVMINRLQRILPPKCHFSFVKSENLVNVVIFCQKLIFSSRPPVFVISSVFRQKRNPLEHIVITSVLLRLLSILNVCIAVKCYDGCLQRRTACGSLCVVVFSRICVRRISADNAIISHKRALQRGLIFVPRGQTIT